MDELKSIKIGLYGLASLSFVAGAVRGFQEANGMVSDHTLDSALINAGALGPAGLGTLVGTAMFTPMAIDEDEYITKTACLTGGAAMGFTAGGVAGYGGVTIGYIVGRLAGEAAKYF